MTHPFELRKEIELRAAAEQVWEAVATGPGLDSWYMGRNEVEPGEGGKARQFFGDFPVEATVTAWEPGRRFAYRGEGEDGLYMALQFVIEPRGSGSLVRLVQTGVLGEGWEEELEALHKGWDMYLHTLDQYLSHFPGRFALVVFGARMATGVVPGGVWPVVMAGLGVTEEVVQGDRVRLTPVGLRPIEGIADYVTSGFLGVRTGDGLYRFIEGLNDTVVVGHHLFSEEVDVRETEQAWQHWLEGLFS
ncbi:SRPBCC family protein [Sphaerisporangium corydalis]|uniref:SRPBCC domain-containing protein n=1 Tax=Sphaerisporangium corydalis TaxID=1441875 RepID=A0ABV9EFY2_9ACTN|nr:SRPBCC domain-containing protein [Sphaerisporangium corydalis]